MEIKILHLYPDLMNLYGEYGNLNLLQSWLKEQKIDVSIDKKSIGDKFSFSSYDFIYCGSGTENNFEVALNDLKKKKAELEDFINLNRCALFTGNSIEFFGNKLIKTDKSEEDLLNFLHFDVERLDDRKTSDVILESSIFKSDVVGFINKQANLIFRDDVTRDDYKPDNVLNLFKVKFGIGGDSENIREGFKKNNLIATYTIGPVLVRNPEFANYIIGAIIKSKDKNFEIKNISHPNEEKGYELVLKELQNRK